MHKISDHEFYTVLEKLEDKDLIFSKVAGLGKPILREDIKTACVSFDSKGKTLNWCFNPTFWKNCSVYKRAFIIAHEMLHILLDHGHRMKGLDLKISNIAADVAINEMLVRTFKFDRNLIEAVDDYCWVDTVFQPPHFNPSLVSQNESFEYYYNLLMKKIEELSGNSSELADGQELVDEHEGFRNISEKEAEELANKLDESLKKHDSTAVKKFREKISKKKDSKSVPLAGTAKGAMERMMDKFKGPRKPKWERVIKNWERRAKESLEADVGTWMKIDRRYTEFYKNDSVFVEGFMEEELPPKRTKLDVFAFLDTSGSCSSLAQRFWDAINSIDKKKFDLHLRCFDVKVYNISLKDKKLYGFGGTYFHILEEHIQQEIKSSNIKYPTVFCLTDGYGTAINPEKPSKWHIFLTENGSTGCFAQGMKVHKLSDYE